MHPLTLQLNASRLEWQRQCRMVPGSQEVEVCQYLQSNKRALTANYNALFANSTPFHYLRPVFTGELKGLPDNNNGTTVIGSRWNQIRGTLS